MTLKADLFKAILSMDSYHRGYDQGIEKLSDNIGTKIGNAAISVTNSTNEAQDNHQVSNWRWHIDEVFVKINGELHYLWRAVDQEGTILDCYVSKRRNKKATLKVLKKLMSWHGRPNEVVTDKLPSYKAALRDIGAMNLQNTTQYHNNQVENSHLHFRRRERGMNKFRSMRSLQKFVAIQSTFLNHFNHQRHLENRENFKSLRQNSLDIWQSVCVN